MLVHFLFHFLDDKEARDLRPAYLREKTFEIDFEDFFGLRREALDERHEFPAALLKAFPVGDQAPGLRREDLGGDVAHFGVESLKEARDIGIGAEDCF